MVGSVKSNRQGSLAPFMIHELFPSLTETASRHLNSQTSGPPCRSVRIMLPFCISLPFCAANSENCLQDLQAQFRHRLSMEWQKPQQIEESYCFPAAMSSSVL
jgi:hypothetical protein